MSLPPPPGPYGQQPPMGGQPGGGAPQPWSQQYPGGPSGPPPSGPAQWGPQQQWAGGPPPPNGGGKVKWILGGLAAILAIALVVVITVLVVRPDGGGNAPNAGGSGSDSEFASANDTGPVNIVTEDPTCEAWNKVIDEYSQVTTSVDWDNRDSTVPASSWTPSQRAMYERVGKAMTQAADRAVSLATKTPHRVMRVLYEQFIAYTRAFSDRIPSYVAKDHNLAAASNAAGAGLANICGAISYRSAQAVAPLVAAVPGPTKVATPEDPNAPDLLLTEPNSACSDWESLVSKFTEDTASWRAIDKGIAAKDWTPEQKSVNESAGPIMLASADGMERLGRQSGNPRFEDVATLAAQYRRGFVTAIPNYTSSDGYLELSATSLVRLVNAACKATE